MLIAISGHQIWGLFVKQQELTDIYSFILDQKTHGSIYYINIYYLYYM